MSHQHNASPAQFLDQTPASICGMENGASSFMRKSFYLDAALQAESADIRSTTQFVWYSSFIFQENGLISLQFCGFNAMK